MNFAPWVVGLIVAASTVLTLGLWHGRVSRRSSGPGR